MIIDLDAAPRGEWFPFRMSTVDLNTGETIWGDPIEGMRVKLRSWKPFFEERAATREMVDEWKVNPKTKAYEKHSYPKELTPEEKKKEREDVFDYAIMELDGFKDKATREPIECSRGNKIKLMGFDWFDRFFVDCQQRLGSYGIEREEEVSENF